MRRLALVALLLSAQELTAQSIIYVNASATGSNNGSTWTNAYTSLQSALDAATSGKQIWVARGTYKPTSDYGLGVGGRYVHFRMKNDVAIYGGFAGGETSTAQRANYGLGQANETILSGDLGTPGDSTDNCYHVFYHPATLGLYSTAVLDGCTITGGNADDLFSPKDGGGGMYNEYCSPTVTNCAFVRNTALAGGAIYSISQSVLTNCTFISNSATYGGAIYCTSYDAFLRVLNCTFTSNTAYSGGAVYNHYTLMYLKQSTFTANSAFVYGGGIYNDSHSQMTTDSCIFVSNAAVYGGGISSTRQSTPELNGCTFIENSARDYGGGMYNDSSSVTLFNCSFSRNTAYMGGGLHDRSASTGDLDSCTFTSNTGTYGAAIWNSSSTLGAANCTFTGNAASNSGGGMYNASARLIATNCLFTLNAAGQWGGAMDDNNSGLLLTNCTITRNTAGNAGGIRVYDCRAATLQNCILWGNTATTTANQIYMNYSVPVIGGYTTTFDHTCYANGAGDIVNTGITFSIVGCTTADPRMLGDGRLLSISPCVNAGVDSYNTTAYDIRGLARRQGTAIDLGAFEWTSGTDPSSTVFYVNQAATGANTGLTWTDAFPSLQSALGLVIPGCQVWVAKGTYYPSSANGLVDDSGDSTRYNHFRMPYGVALYGGFAGGETALAQRNVATNLTTLSGDIGTPGYRDDNCYHVIYNPSQTPAIDTSAVLDGFTITGGYSDHSDGYHDYGAGMYNDHASPRIANCTFTANSAAGQGGGMYNRLCSPDVSNCLFTQNYGCYGGGMHNSAASPSVTACAFTLNSSWDSGAGMANESGSSPHVTNCTFSRDSSYIQGGALANDSSSAIITNCVFTLNRGGYGGAMFNLWSSAVITNCTFTQNRADFWGGGMCNWATRVTVNNCILWADTADGGGHEFYSYYDTTVVRYSCFANQADDVLDTCSTFSYDAHCISGDPNSPARGSVRLIRMRSPVTRRASMSGTTRASRRRLTSGDSRGN